LTLILKKQPKVLDSVTGGQDTVGLRIPRHPVARALLQAFGGGVAAPSANKFTHVSPTTALAVEEELGAEVDLILEGGACEVGLESTILDLSSGTPILLRPGMITVAMLEAVLQTKVQTALGENTIKAPGMHHLHYAPMTPTVSLPIKEILPWLENQNAESAVILLQEEQRETFSLINKFQTFVMPNDAESYAHDLYHQLRTADHLQVDFIVIAEIPKEVNWYAIQDRINKATAR
jgi:L-threonylcarbamoyladenylate synthase